MPKGIKIGGRDFAVGDGRPRKQKYTPEKRMMKKAERDAKKAYLKKLEKMLPLTFPALEAALKAPTQTRTIVTKKGDVVEIDPGPGELMAGIASSKLVQDRLFGNPKQAVEHSGEVLHPTRKAQPSIEERIKEVRQIASILIECGVIPGPSSPGGNGADPKDYEIHSPPAHA